MSKVKYIFIHHSAVSYTKNPDQAIATNTYHKQKWNFRSSLGFYGGYNYEISMNGKVTKFREEGEPTAAQYQRNMNNGQAVSICLDMNGDIESPKDKQIFALRDLLQQIQKRHVITIQNIFFHRDVAGYKTCPGKKMDLKWVRNHLALNI